jgi:phosphatidylserine decarboxylase
MSLKRDLGVALQYALPHQLLSRIVHYATRITWAPWKNLLIDQISWKFRIDLSEAEAPGRDAYPHFNAFFTRALKAGARPIAPDPDVMVSPADGAISQAGPLDQGRIFQAKGLSYTVEELLADPELAARFPTGSFATVYLSPRDYHRVHLPCDARLTDAVHVPGRLFSVAPWTTESIPRLFARNERLVCCFETERGPLAVVLVGAILVSGIETVFGGVHTPPYASRIHRTRHDRSFAKGDELGRFNMGSTAIIVAGFPLDFAESIQPDQPIRMGQPLARMPGVIRAIPSVPPPAPAAPEADTAVNIAEPADVIPANAGIQPSSDPPGEATPPATGASPTA